MKHTYALIIYVLCTLGPLCAQQVKPGIEVLRDRNFDVLQGKRIGLVTNPTGTDSNLESTIDILYNAEGVELAALFGPEHGVRGDVHAGGKVGNMTDEKTGLPVYSLYGSTRKPTPEMLEGIDAIVYDIQDIGCRSYTFISTLGLVMEAAGENFIEVIVLDRPNPLGGIKIEGSVPEDGRLSFVGMYKIPYIYGLTCGELAMMINEEGMTGKKCKLTVIPMEGWKREMTYSDTGLPWILPSPHIPYDETACYYPATGILGELGYISIGVGYTLPFKMFAAEWIDAEEFANAMNDLNLPGWHFRPVQITPFYGMGKGKSLGGAELFITDMAAAKLTEPQFYAVQVLAVLYPEHMLDKVADEKRFAMYDKILGTSYIRETFFKNLRFEDIKEYWYKDAAQFREMSSKYHLYK